jgi:hypothetical protein
LDGNYTVEMYKDKNKIDIKKKLNIDNKSYCLFGFIEHIGNYYSKTSYVNKKILNNEINNSGHYIYYDYNKYNKYDDLNTELKKYDEIKLKDNENVYILLYKLNETNSLPSFKLDNKDIYIDIHFKYLDKINDIIKKIKSKKDLDKKWTGEIDNLKGNYNENITLKISNKQDKLFKDLLNEFSSQIEKAIKLINEYNVILKCDINFSKIYENLSK